MKKNLPKESRRGFPQYAYSANDAEKHAGYSRQVHRASVLRRRFRRMEGTESHIVLNPKTGRVIGILPLRAERRRLARAYAAGDWNKRKAVV